MINTLFMVKKQEKNSFWKPVKLKSIKLKSTKLKPLFSSNLKPINKKNLTWPQAKALYPKLNPRGDADRDGVKNCFDCRPFNKKRQDEPVKKSLKLQQGQYVIQRAAPLISPPQRALRARNTNYNNQVIEGQEQQTIRNTFARSNREKSNGMNINYIGKYAGPQISPYNMEANRMGETNNFLTDKNVAGQIPQVGIADQSPYEEWSDVVKYPTVQDSTDTIEQLDTDTYSESSSPKDEGN